MSEWLPIETAPKDGESVLLCAVHPTHNYIAEGYRDGSRFYVANNGDYHAGGYGRDYQTGEQPTEYGYLNPTHWMPLPSPPSQ